MKKRINFFYFIFSLNFCFVLSQTGEVTNHIFDGNEKANEEDYKEAEKSYRKAISLEPEKEVALYNLGNTHFKDKKYDEASQRFFQTQKFASSKQGKHRAFHNMGNVYMQKKEYQKAVEAYKNALRNNPKDEETRYNYALAKELLENEKPPEEQEQDDQKDQKDQEKDKEKDQEKNQDGDQENKDQKNPKKEGDEGDDSDDKGDPNKEGDQKKEQKPKEQKPQNDRPKRGQLSPQQVESLLEAMNNQEKKVQDKINAKKIKGAPARGKKDW